MRDRVAAESTEREARLQLMSERQRERHAQARIRERASSQLFKQYSVQEKMKRFHAHLSSLHAPTCTPSVCAALKTNTHQNYSSAKNMNPGPLPHQLQVGKYLFVE